MLYVVKSFLYFLILRQKYCLSPLSFHTESIAHALLLSLWAVMAASCVFSKLHMRRTLLKNPQKVERFLNRTVRTVASAQSEVFQAGERLLFVFFLFVLRGLAYV